MTEQELLPVQNGDIVEILTSKACPGPSRDWLTIAKSGSARTKIKQWFKKEKREENIVTGRDMLEGELRRAGLSVAQLLESEAFASVMKKMTFLAADDLYAAIGYGGVTATKIVNRLRDEIARAQKAANAKTTIEKINEAGEKRTEREQKKNARAIQGVLVEGIDSCLVKFARCCTPVPGDAG